MLKIIYTICLTFSIINTFAQVEIQTDRPGKTISPITVLKKWTQFETGFSIQTEKINIPKKDLYIQHPYLLTKYGLGKYIELRLITELATIKEKNVNANTTYFGINNFQLGGKINFLNLKKIRTIASLIGHYNFNSLRTIIKGKDSIDGANFRFALQHNFSEKIFLAYNVGMEWKRFGSAPAYIYTFSPRIKITEKWFAFIEVFGSIWKDVSPENSMDFGVAYHIGNNLKIDASAGFGLNKKAPDNFYAIGGSFRFKTFR